MLPKVIIRPSESHFLFIAMSKHRASSCAADAWDHGAVGQRGGRAAQGRRPASFGINLSARSGRRSKPGGGVGAALGAPHRAPSGVCPSLSDPQVGKMAVSLSAARRVAEGFPALTLAGLCEAASSQHHHRAVLQKQWSPRRQRLQVPSPPCCPLVASLLPLQCHFFLGFLCTETGRVPCHFWFPAIIFLPSHRHT